ncbi:MAG: RluA family pseudouridine synthase [Candidatus Nitrohelix vancouverensis]|uniref:Pseudouridine synthase n=1 Tax=Candidatus Nitrohelix vancouverensis TaxID=2705534 RepID=A0A7T0C164_9BACT|nr:MAG: RluA family pseudouridine synthase [Candidatus Nitrohelix vancouverensis]
MELTILQFTATDADAGMRLDVFLAEAQSEVTRSQIKKWIDADRALVNGRAEAARYKLKAGDAVCLEPPPLAPSQTLAESIPLKILFEDEHFLVIDKPAGMVTHPAPGHSGGTLVNALLHHCKDLPGIGGVERPGIVHRLDKETSGLVAVAKTNAALNHLAGQFKNRTIQKVYLALAQGRFKEARGKIDSSVGRHKGDRKKMTAGAVDGREAETYYEVKEQYDLFAWLRLFPKTGRTHQIRVHLASINHPVLGDKLYGGRMDPRLGRLSRHALHAHRLELNHPATEERMLFESPFAPDLESYRLRATKS